MSPRDTIDRMPSGYVYILWNPAMGDLLKIGKTARDPSTRVAELSAATGVPTPFKLAYYTETVDCEYLERSIHERLTALGHRYTDQREFFTAPLHVAVRITVEAAATVRATEPATAEDGLRYKRTPLWQAAQREAEKTYTGATNGLPPDLLSAWRLFERAAALGSPQAHRGLAKMKLRGEGGDADEEAAEQHLRDGANAGDVPCFAELALLHAEDTKNADKWWRAYFDKILTVKQSDQKRYASLYRAVSPDAIYYKTVPNLLSAVKQLRKFVGEALTSQQEIASVPAFEEELERLGEELKEFDLKSVPVNRRQLQELSWVIDRLDRVTSAISKVYYKRRVLSPVPTPLDFAASSPTLRQALRRRIRKTGSK